MFDGWTPAEVHEHYDAEGNLTGTTVVTRESEWDADTRGRALRLAEYQSSFCPCGCGQPIDVAYDKTQAFKVDHMVCQAGRALARVQREEERKAQERKAPDGWDDGRRYYVTPVAAEGKEAT